MFKIKGKVKVVFDTQVVSEKFKKRDFVITDDGQYPQDILFQCNQDKCDSIDFLAPGTEVEVSFNLRGREWVNPQGEAKYFNTLEAWRVEAFDRGNKMESTANAPQAHRFDSMENDDDLGF